MEDGGWKMEDGRDGRWRMEDGGWKGWKIRHWNIIDFPLIVGNRASPKDQDYKDDEPGDAV